MGGDNGADAVEDAPGGASVGDDRFGGVAPFAPTGGGDKGGIGENLFGLASGAGAGGAVKFAGGIVEDGGSGTGVKLLGVPGGGTDVPGVGSDFVSVSGVKTGAGGGGVSGVAGFLLRSADDGSGAEDSPFGSVIFDFPIGSVKDGFAG